MPCPPKTTELTKGLCSANIVGWIEETKPNKIILDSFLWQLNQMNNTVEDLPLEAALTLRDSSDSPLTIGIISLSLTKQDTQLIECRLTFSINPELYHHIDTNALFNLKPEIRGTFTNQFQSSPDIKIEI